MNAYWKQIVKLFFPLLVARIGLFLLSAVDTVMLGYASAEHVALQSIGDTPVSLVLLIVDGLLQGTFFTTTHAFGRKDYIGVGQSFREALKYGAWLSLLAIPCFCFLPMVVSVLGYTAEQSEAAASIIRILSLGIPFSVMFFVCTFFLNGIKQIWVVTAFVFGANFINIGLDWVLINGMLGFPRLLSVGAAIATCVVRGFMGCGLLAYILCCSDFKKFRFFERTKKQSVAKEQKKFGYGATANILSHEIGIAFCLFFVANIEMMSASAYTLVYRFYVLANVLGCCFALAGSILSGKYVKENNEALSAIYKTTLLVNAFVMCLVGLGCFFGAEKLAYWMTSDIGLAKITVPLIRVISLAMFLRATNSVQIILLRNSSFLLWPSLLYGGCFALLMPVVCVWWGGLFGVCGVVWSLIVANICATMMLQGVLVRKKLI